MVNRRHPLFTLEDNGSPKRIPPEVFNFVGRDRGWTQHADNFLSANRHSLGELSVDVSLQPSASDIHLSLVPDGRIGAVPLYAPDTRRIVGGVVVKPRFGWGGIGLALQRIGWSASPKLLPLPMVPGSAREVPPWVLAGPVLERLRRLLRDIRRGFHMREETRESPRGQILWSAYATQQLSRGRMHQLPCRYPDLSPDLQLLGHIRWGLEMIRSSLQPYAAVDVIARSLEEHIREQLHSVSHVRALEPRPQELERLLHLEGLPNRLLQEGLQALGWLVEQRGLAGSTESDGLAWRLDMHELYERWVVHLVRQWAKGFGGAVLTGADEETSTPLQWSSRIHSSMSRLVPDVVVRTPEQVMIFDAKYKSHFEELDVTRWREAAENLREQHRRDVHQVLAYAALFEAPKIRAVLAYPMHLESWQRLAAANAIVSQARLTNHGRDVTISLAAVPLFMPDHQTVRRCIASWDILRS